MKNIEDIMQILAGHGIINDLTDIIRAHNQDFVEEEKNFLAAVEIIRSNLSTDFSSSFDEYLKASYEDIISRCMVAGWLGFKLNLENFRQPFGIHFTHRDFVDEVKSNVVGCFPANHRAEKIATAFHKIVPEDLSEHYEDIGKYFVSLECDAPKLAHYAGYIIGNELLPLIEPGYHSDGVQTISYRKQVRDWFGYVPL